MAFFLQKDQEIFSGRHPVDFIETYWNPKLQVNCTSHSFKKPIYDARGAPVMLVCAMIDITEANQLPADLRASVQKLSGLFELAPVGIALTDLQGHYLEVNDAFQSICGYSREELSRLDDWNLIPAADQAQGAEQLRLLASTGRYGPYEKDYIRKDGAPVPLRLNGMLMTDEVGKKFIWSIVEDMSQQKQSEARLVQSQKMEALGTLAGGVAHDFNNILTGMQGFAELLQQDLPPGTPQHHYISRVVAGCERARTLVQQILSFARQSSVATTALDLRRVVAEAANFLTGALPATASLQVETTPNEVVCTVNEGQVHQVLVNLCVNASDALEGRPGKIRLTLDLAAPGDLRDFARTPPDPEIAFLTHGALDHGCAYACLSVSDSGNGIARSVIERIFDPFFTTKDRSRGTGLGLAIVHGIVTAWDGAYQVRSREKVGTTVTIYFKANPTAAVAPPVRDGRASLRGGERILVVDDEQDIVDALQVGLGRLGYQLQGCRDPDEALTLFLADPAAWDLVISDQSMPVMTGTNLMARMKAVRPELKTILCTGFSDGSRERMASTLGIDAVVLKPISVDRLAERIRGLMDLEARQPGHEQDK